MLLLDKCNIVFSTSVLYVRDASSVTFRMPRLRYYLPGSLSLSVFSLIYVCTFFTIHTACNCSLAGAFGGVCNITNGQCPCRPNVEGRQCGSCAVNYYDFGNSQGCQACLCNETGSESLQCNATGACTCRRGVGGLKCGECQDRFYGLSTSGCLGRY